jgi:hypothetical protein
MRSALFALAVGLAVGGCSDTLSPNPQELSGEWVESFTVPGNGFSMDLAVDGSNVVGFGTFSGEACCSGTIAVTGTVNGAAVDLDIVSTVQSGRVVGATAHSRFEGKLITARTLKGTLTDLPTAETPQSSRDVTYHRQ